MCVVYRKGLWIEISVIFIWFFSLLIQDKMPNLETEQVSQSVKFSWPRLLFVCLLEMMEEISVSFLHHFFINVCNTISIYTNHGRK